MPVTDASTMLPAGPRGGRRGELWRCAIRLQPRCVLAGIAALATAWAFGSRVDVTSERTLLIALSTVGLSVVMVDPADAVTAASPTPLWVRRMRASALGVGLAGASWVIVRLGAAVVYDRTSFPVGWEFLEWATIGSSQLALGAASTRERTEASLGPGLILALMWWVVTAAPRTQERLLEVGDHGWTWLGLLTLFVALAATASIDPARGRCHADSIHRPTT